MDYFKKFKVSKKAEPGSLIKAAKAASNGGKKPNFGSHQFLQQTTPMMKRHKKRKEHSREAIKGLEKFAHEEAKEKKSKKRKEHKKNWIKGAIKHPGALHRELGVKEGHKIPASRLRAAAKKGGVEGRRARLAETLKHLHHKKHKKVHDGMSEKAFEEKRRPMKKEHKKSEHKDHMCKTCGKTHKA